MNNYKLLMNVENVYINRNKIVITGYPDGEDETHNCDEMGCSSYVHVMIRAEMVNVKKGYDEVMHELPPEPLYGVPEFSE